MTVYVCEKCIHRYPKGGCLVPSNLGYVEQCKHFTEESKPKQMTNEEWLKQANTEQLAEFLADKCNEVVDWILHEMDENAGDIDQDEYWFRQDAFVEWLKQPYKE